MSEAIIRTLRRDDYPALIDLVRRTWYAEFDERTGLLAAEADWENCLARTTNAFVAELDGQPVALIVGRVDALDHRSPLNSHRINSWNALGASRVREGRNQGRRRDSGHSRHRQTAARPGRERRA